MGVSQRNKMGLRVMYVCFCLSVRSYVHIYVCVKYTFRKLIEGNRCYLNGAHGIIFYICTLQTDGQKKKNSYICTRKSHTQVV